MLGRGWGGVGSGGQVGGGGVTVDVNEELKFLRKLTKKIGGGGSEAGGGGGGSGGGSGFWGDRMDMNEELSFCEN